VAPRRRNSGSGDKPLYGCWNASECRRRIKDERAVLGGVFLMTR
jgi:hypothetical protein